MGTTLLDSTASVGSWGYTGEHIILPETSSNTNAGLGVYSQVDYAATADKVFAGAYHRLVALTTSQANSSTMVGSESQFRLRGVDIANGVHAGLWAYAEQSGTSAMTGTGTFDAISATVESSGDFSAVATNHITGGTFDSSINAGATINANTNFSAIYVKSNGLDWFNGIRFSGVDIDIRGQNDETIDNATDGSWDFDIANIIIAGTVDGVDVSALAAVVPSGSNNEVLTDDGAGAIVSESGLTFDGTNLLVNAGDIDMTTTADNQIIFAIDNDGVTPSVTLEPGTGWYASADNVANLALAGGSVWEFTNTYMEGNYALGPKIMRETPSPTNPIFVSDGDENTGYGHAHADQSSYVVGGKEAVRLSEGTDYISSITGHNVTETITDATTNGTTTITKAGEMFETSVSVGDMVVIWGGLTEGTAYGNYIVESITNDENLVLDRIVAAHAGVVDFDILADGVVIENATDVTSHVARLRVPKTLYIGADYDDVEPAFYMTGDADDDAGGDTKETLTLTLTPDVNPLLAYWGFTTTQSAGYRFDKALSIGSWGYTGEHFIIPEASSNTNAGLGVYSMVNYAATAGKVFAGSYSRMLNMTADQPNLATMVGLEAQYRLRDVDVAAGVHAGLWAYAEQSGTSALTGGATFDAISATVESEGGFSTDGIGVAEQITGGTFDSSINAGATVDATTNFSAIYVKSNGLDWFNGIRFSGVDVDIRGQNDETIDNATDGSWDFGTSNIILNGLVDGLDIATDLGNATAHISASGASHTYIDQDLTIASTGGSLAGLAITGELDMTDTDAFIDINPTGSTDIDVINITPVNAIPTTVDWRGMYIDGGNLDPSGATVTIKGLEIDYSGVDLTNTPAIDGIIVAVPAGYDAINVTGNVTEDGKTIYVPNAASNAGTSVADDAAITVTNRIMRMVGADADAVLDTDPAINDGSADGEIVIIQGTADGNLVTVADNVNTQLAGGLAMSLGDGDILALMWDSNYSMWIELYRSDN